MQAFYTHTGYNKTWLSVYKNNSVTRIITLESDVITECSNVNISGYIGCAISRYIGCASYMNVG